MTAAPAAAPAAGSPAAPASRPRRFQLGRLGAVVSCAALVYAAGAVTGLAVSFGVVRHFLLRPPAAADVSSHLRGRLTREAGLRSDQVARVQPLIDEAGRQLVAIHRETLQQVYRVTDELDRQVLPLLTPEQRHRFRADLRRRRREHRAERDDLAAFREAVAAPAPPPSASDLPPTPAAGDVRR